MAWPWQPEHARANVGSETSSASWADLSLPLSLRCVLLYKWARGRRGGSSRMSRAGGGGLLRPRVLESAKALASGWFHGWLQRGAWPGQQRGLRQGREPKTRVPFGIFLHTPPSFWSPTPRSPHLLPRLLVSPSRWRKQHLLVPLSVRHVAGP